MKPILALTEEKSLRWLATPSDFRLGQEIAEQGGVELREVGAFKVVAKARPVGGQRRTVELTSTEDGLKCRCT